MPFTKNEILELLQLEKEDKIQPAGIEYDSQGPGYFDVWAALEGRGAKPFAVNTNSAKNKRPKIIISTSLDIQFSVTCQKTDFIMSLIQECDVYLWQKKEGLFATKVPINSFKEFFGGNLAIEIAAKTSVAEALVEQHILPADYIILDTARFQCIFDKITDKPRDTQWTAEQEIFLQDDLKKKDIISQRFDCHKVKVIHTDDDLTEVNVREIHTLFPNLQTIYAGLTEVADIHDNITYSIVAKTATGHFTVKDTYHGREFSILDFEGGGFTLQSATTTKLTLIGHTLNESLEKCDLEKASNLQELFLKDFDIDSLTLPEETKSMRHITLEKCGARDFDLDLTAYTNLDHLTLKDCEIETIHFPLFGNKIKTLAINSTHFTNFSQYFLNCENLTLEQDLAQPPIDLRHLSKLKKLILENIEYSSVLFNPPRENKIEELWINGCYQQGDDPVFPLDLRNFTRLEKLGILKQDLRKGRLPTDGVKELHLSENLTSPIDFNAFAHLEKLTYEQHHKEDGNRDFDFSRNNALKILKLNLKKASRITLNQNLISLEIANDDKNPTIIHLPKVNRLEKLIIRGSVLLEGDHLGQSLKNLTIEGNQHLNQLNLIQCAHLKNISLFKCSNLKMVVLPEKIAAFHFTGFALPVLQNIKHIDELILRNLKQVSFTNKITVQKLRLDSCSIVEESSINIAHSTAIAHCMTVSILEIENCHLNKVQWPDKINILNICAPTATQTVSQIDLTGIKTIECLNISKMIDLLEIKFPPGILIRHLNISFCQALAALDLSKIDGLENIELSNYRLKNIIWSMNHPYKNIKIVNSHNRNEPNVPALDIANTHFSKLEKLSLTGWTLSSAINAPLLKECTIENRADNHISLTNTSSLTSLKVSTDKQITIEGLNNCTQLKKLKLNGLIDAIEQLQYQAAVPAICEIAISQAVDFNSTLNNALNQGEQSSVSIFNLASHCLTNDLSNPNQVQPTVAQGNFKLTLFSKDSVPKALYRINILHSVEMEGFDRLYFNTGSIHRIPIEYKEIQPLTDDILKKITSDTQQNGALQAGYLEGEFHANQFYALINSAPVQQVKDLTKHLFFEPAGLTNSFSIRVGTDKHYEVKRDRLRAVSLQLYWEKENQRYCFRLNTTYPIKLKIGYIFERLPSQPCKSLPMLHDSKTENTNDLRDYFANLLQANEQTAFLFNPDSDTNQKFVELIQYCRDFTIKEPSLDHFKPLDIFLQRILDQRGVCLDSSQAFMFLCSLLGVKAQMIVNEVHAYTEISWVENGVQDYQLINLAGAIPPPDMTQRGENIFKKFIAPKLRRNKSQHREEKEVESIAPLDEIALDYHARYIKEFENAVKIKEIASLNEIMDSKEERPPLMLLNDTQDVLKVNTEIMCGLNEKHLNLKQQYLFISKPEDFAMFLHPVALNKGQHVATSNHVLFSMLTNNQDAVIVINWSAFDSTERASFQTIADQPPTLLGETIRNPRLKFIGLQKQTQATQNDAAFTSRFACYSLSPNFLKERLDLSLEKQLTTIQVDLSYGQHWRESLYGRCDSYLIIESQLMQALRKKCPIHLQLINKPKDSPDLEIFLHRLTSEKKFMFNGEFILIDNDIKVTVLDHKLDMNPAQCSLIKDFSHKNKIYLGMHNLYECTKQFISTSSKQLLITGGYAAHYNPVKDVFYITDQIAQADWQALHAQLSRDYPEKKIEFALAPFAEICEFAQTEAPAHKAVLTRNFGPKDLDTNQVIETNDPDFAVLQLVQDRTDIIVREVHPNTKFNHLICRSYVKNAQFYNESLFVLNELQKGQTVILTGKISPALYQQLLPLLSNPPRFYHNGHWLPEKDKPWGKLILVTEENTLSCIESLHRHYYLKDYMEALRKDKTDEPHCKALGEFYHLLQLNLQKQARLPLSFALFQKMLRVLSSKGPFRHPHFPLKGFLSYHYAKNSEFYAYTCVIGKYLFRTEDRACVRKDKLKQLMQQFRINSVQALAPHIFKILNCFYGHELRQLFGRDISTSLVAESDCLTLTSLALKQVYDRIQNLLMQEEKSLPRESHDKNLVYLKHFLNSKEDALMILKGPPGVGKTYTVRQLLGDYIVGNQEGILKWLASDPASGIPVLFLDEANMAAPGTWDFLIGLLRNKKVVYIDRSGHEQVYHLSAKHKVIACMNFDDDEGRYQHRLFYNNAETLYFAKPKRDHLEKMILQKILTPYQLNRPEYLQVLLDVYEFIQIANPHLVTSYRDIEDLACRFILLSMQNKNKEAALWQACHTSFYGTFKDQEDREAFCKGLNDLIPNHRQITPVQRSHFLEEKSQPQLLPHAKTYLMTALQQFLDFRQMEEQHPIFATQTKRAIILHGTPGVGKSTLIRHILRQNNLTKEGVGKNRYYEINAGTKNAYELIKTAFFTGACIILDEINLDTGLEQLLTHYLTGERTREDDPNRKIIPGFRLLASENSATLGGRRILSPAARNRALFLYFDDFTAGELEEITGNQVMYPKQFVDAYFQTASKYKEINMRTFRQVLQNTSLQFSVGAQEKPSNKRKEDMGLPQASAKKRFGVQ